MDNIVKICALITLISFNGVSIQKNSSEVSVRKVRFDLTPAEIKEHSGSMRLLSSRYICTHPSVVTGQVRNWFRSNRFNPSECGTSFFEKISDNLQNINRLSYKTNLCYIREDGYASVFLNASDPNSFNRFIAYINNVINPYPDMKNTAEEDGKIMRELTKMPTTDAAANEFKKRVLSTTAKIYDMRI